MCLNGLGKCPRLTLACINACKWCSMVERVFFSTQFVISSGPGALSGANLLIASLICQIVIWSLYETSCGYTYPVMSLRFADGGLGKKLFLSSANFCSIVAASFSRVGIKVGV